MARYTWRHAIKPEFYPLRLVVDVFYNKLCKLCKVTQKSKAYSIVYKQQRYMCRCYTACCMQ